MGTDTNFIFKEILETKKEKIYIWKENAKKYIRNRNWVKEIEDYLGLRVNR